MRRFGFLCSVMLLVLAFPALTRPPAAKARTYFHEEVNVLRLGNEQIELVLDRHSGFWKQLLNKQTGVSHLQPDGAFPFGCEVGSYENPADLTAEVSADGVQHMVYRTWIAPGGSRVLHLQYPELLDNKTRRKTGIAAAADIEIAPGHDYFLIRVSMTNRGTNLLTKFYSKWGRLLTGEDDADSRMVSNPAAGPRKLVAGKFAIPWFWPLWADAFGRRSGVGFGYANRQMMNMNFDVQTYADGISINWSLFRLRSSHNTWVAPEWRRAEGGEVLYPLKPGESWTSDNFILAAHPGPWFRMARIYRAEYERAFRGAMLTWDTLSPAARRALINLDFSIATTGYWNNLFPVRWIQTKFTDVPGQFAEACRLLGVDTSKAGTNMGFLAHYQGRHPEIFPLAPEAGGTEGAREMVRQLREQMHAVYVLMVTHPYYNHPKAANYVPEADAGGTLNPVLGNYVCAYNSSWQKVWVGQIVPQFRAIGVAGLNLDEGTEQRRICERTGPAHLHGSGTVGLLTQQGRGLFELQRMMRHALGPDGFLKPEGYSDTTGIWFDEYEWRDPMSQYTHPDHVWVGYGQPDEPYSANYVFVNGLLPEFFPGNIRDKLATASTLKRALALRDELMTRHAPGYPYGYRETEGIRTGEQSVEIPGWRVRKQPYGFTSTLERSDADERLMARTFSGKDGVTVLYAAIEAVETDLHVDCRTLGHSELGTRTIHLKLDKDQAGYETFPVQSQRRQP